MDCSKHRTISIMSQISRFVFKVFGAKLKSKVIAHVDEKLCDFRKGKGTRDAIFLLRKIMERAIEK